MAIEIEHSQAYARIDNLLQQCIWYGQKHTQHLLMQAALSLTIPQMVTLAAIRDQGRCCMGTLADLTRQSAGTLTGIVDRLISEGLVDRVRDPSDRRIIYVMLTQAGQDMLAHVEQLRRIDTEALLEDFSDHDLDALEELLRRISRQFNEHTQPEVEAVTNVNRTTPAGSILRRLNPV